MSIQCGNVSPLALNSCPMPIRIELKLPKNSICSPTYMFADSRPLPSRYLHRVPHIKHNNIIYPVDGRKQRNVCVIMCCHPRAAPSHICANVSSSSRPPERLFVFREWRLAETPRTTMRSIYRRIVNMLNAKICTSTCLGGRTTISISVVVVLSAAKIV